MNDIANDGQVDTGAVEGEATVSFLDGIQDESLKGHEALTGIESIEDLAKGYIDIKGSLPQTPDSIDAYSFDIPEEIQGQIDEEAMTEFKQLALDNKLTPDAYKAIIDFRTKEISAQVEALTKEKAAAVEAMKVEFGDKFDTNLDAAQKVLKQFESEDLLNLESPEEATKYLGNSPALFKFLVKVAEATAEDDFGTGGGTKHADKRQTDDAGQPLIKFKDM